MNRYPGTLPFTTAQKHIFFGRKKEIEDLYQLIRLRQLVVLYGKSGLGKSSLIQAGIIPKVTEAGAFQPIYIRFTAFKSEQTDANANTPTPTQITQDNLTKGYEAATFLAELHAEENSLWASAKKRQINGGGHRLILFFDQFEELFQYPESDIQVFTRQLRELLTTDLPQRLRNEINQQADDLLTEAQEELLFEALDIKVVFGIRSDRMHLLNKLSRHLPQILSNNYELLPLSLADAQDAIVLPAQQEGDFDTPAFAYTEGSLRQILTFLKDKESQRIEAFQLQLLCQTFEQRVHREGIQLIDESAVQNLDRIIDEYFQKSIAELPDEEQTLVENLIAEELLSPDGKVRYSTFEQKLKSDYEMEDELLQKLINLRLLRRERTHRGMIYEISHDTFLPSAREIKAKLEEAEQAAALAQAKAQAEQERQRAEEQVLLRSEAESERNRAKRASRISVVVAIVAVLLAIVATFLGVYAYYAQQETKIALENTQKAQEETQAALQEANYRSHETAIKSAISYGKSYQSLNKDTFACQSYQRADSLLQSLNIEDWKNDSLQVEAQELQKNIQELKNQLSCDHLLSY